MVHDGGPILLFDGECNLCSGAVGFVLRRDRKRQFRFASLQSEAARQLLEKAAVRADNDVRAGGGTVVLILDDEVYVESSAALRVAAHLGGAWRLLAVLLFIPRPVRDAVYRWIARHRYGWFGRRDSCYVPTADVRDRFLDAS